jgi:2'-5' RNA ligase
MLLEDPGMHRLFVAIRPPRAMRAALCAVTPPVPGARWQDDDQVHLTLRFVGAVERPLAEDIAVALSGIVASAFTLTLGAPGHFDRRDRLDSLWVAAGPVDRLAALHRKVDRVLVDLGLPPEGRAYRPHITLARFGRNAGDPAPFLHAAAPLMGLAAPVAHFALFESHLGPDGAAYSCIARYPLHAPPC